MDANGKLNRQQALAYARFLEPYSLYWFEEPGDPLDFDLQKALAEAYPHPLATGENLFSHQDVRNLLRYGEMRKDKDWLQCCPSGRLGYFALYTARRRHQLALQYRGWFGPERQ